MKKVIMTLAIAVSSLFAFAGDKNVNQNVLNAFNTEFEGATEVTWSEADDVYKASFLFNNQSISAFYSADGELMSVARNISSLELPQTLQNKLRTDYGNYWISALSEISNSNEDTDYYITMENADAKVVLKSNGRKWNLVKKITKA